MKYFFLKLPLVSFAAAITFSTTASAESATYAVDPTHTFVTWEVKHFGTSTSHGRFDKKSGTITLDKVAKTGKAELTIDMTSMSTDVAQFDKHLSSDDFFSAAKFPEAKFIGSTFTFDGDKVASIAGTLTLRGKTNPVVLKASSYGCYQSPYLKREVCGGDFETTIARSQYDVSYGLPGIPDNVRLLIQVEAIKQ